jgi:hypothetical protein
MYKNATKTVHKGTKMIQNRTKTVQKRSKNGTKTVQKCTKTVQKLYKTGTKTVRNGTKMYKNGTQRYKPETNTGSWAVGITVYRVQINYRRISLRHNLSKKCRKIVKFVSITHSERNIWNQCWREMAASPTERSWRVLELATPVTRPDSV